MGQKCNFSSDQISMPEGSLLSNQENSLFKQVPIEGFNQGNLSHPHSGRDGLSPQETSDLGLSHPASLEQKVLYSLDGKIWEVSLGSNKTSYVGFESTIEHGSHVDSLPPLQSGTSSDLMRSIGTKTYCSGLQEEQRGFSFKNSKPLDDNKSLKLVDGEKLRNKWVDGSSQHASSLNFSGGEYNHIFWHQACTHRDGGIQRPYDKVNQLDMRRTSVDPQNMDSAENMEALAARSGVSSVQYGKSITAPSENVLEQLNKGDTSNNQMLSKYSFWREMSLAPSSVPSDCGFRLGREDLQTQQSHSFSPSMVNTSSTSAFGHNVSAYIKHGDPLSHTAAEFSGYSATAYSDNRLKMQLNLASFSQGCSLSQPTAVTYEIPDASISKKHEAFEMISWCKEVEHKILRPPDIRNAEFKWAETPTRRLEEVMQVINEADNSEEFFPVIPAKRRLIRSTQLMRQVFPPAPAVILCSDAISNSDCVAYLEARLALGDVFRPTAQLPPRTSETSFDKLKTLKRTNYRKFANAAEGLKNQVKKIEGDILRLDESLSLVDLKVRARDLEKFSIINRFSKFYIMSRLNTASASGTSTSHKAKPQRYVTAVPMPNTIPEVVDDCLSL